MSSEFQAWIIIIVTVLVIVHLIKNCSEEKPFRACFAITNQAGECKDDACCEKNLNNNKARYNNNNKECFVMVCGIPEQLQKDIKGCSIITNQAGECKDDACCEKNLDNNKAMYNHKNECFVVVCDSHDKLRNKKPNFDKDVPF